MDNNDINPILNNPYEEPLYHYDTDINGNLDYTRRLVGRRPYVEGISIVPKKQSGQKEIFSGSDVYDEESSNAKFINGLREIVKEWRDKGYPGTTKVTKELLDCWFNNEERPNQLRLFFCQREAVETAVWLNEIMPRDPNLGRAIEHELEERRSTVSENPDYVLPRTAFKMATGTGKTVVMAMLILYHYINKKVYPTDTRFADHFLLVAPGITIRDRLGVLYIDSSRKNQFDKADYYHQRGLIPNTYEKLLEGLNACITITNFQQLEPKVLKGKHASPFDGKIQYDNEGNVVKLEAKQDYSLVLNGILGKNMKGKRLIVINDEAHHCYLPHIDTSKKKRAADDEVDNEHAMIWYEGLRQLKLQGYKLQQIYDLSATPFYLKGSGHPEYSMFPWIVTDFGLVDAIESGLVKIPFLPVDDSSTDLEEPKLRDLYNHIKEHMPKKGQKAQRKAVREKEEETGQSLKGKEMPPNLPTLLNMALDQFVKDYQEYEDGLRGGGEMNADLFSTPPVFIVVCNNTTASKEVYKYIAGYETTDDNGNTVCVEGHFPIFSNYRNGMPLKKSPTLLIDSGAIDEAGATINDEFKSIFRDEIDIFRREYAQLHGAGSADNLTEGDILREVVNTVGRNGKLGGHIRCVVSVSMLTEGWDANTVTHVCGLRAFGSQLLCEQVAGRALRRRSYEMEAYDRESGEKLTEQDLKDYRRKHWEKKITYKFPPEYAHIIGIPFKTFKGGATPPPPPPKEQHEIYAMHERDNMEIRFPNVEGYRVDTPDGEITADFSNVPKLKLDFNDIPLETELATSVGDKVTVLRSDYKELRDAQVIYDITSRLLKKKYSDNDQGVRFHLFGKLKKVVEEWYYNQVEILGGTGDPDLRRLVVFVQSEDMISNIAEGILHGKSDEQRITPVLNYYNPEGSSSMVHGRTTKEVLETTKSHVNYVVCDTASWEQKAALALESMSEVLFYVKNHFLHFEIPYMLGTQERRYIPDFIADVMTPNGELVHLVIEISGFSNDITGHKDVKRYYTTEYWVPAVNNMKNADGVQLYGRWDFIEITDIDTIKQVLTEKINSL